MFIKFLLFCAFHIRISIVEKNKHRPTKLFDQGLEREIQLHLSCLPFNHLPVMRGVRQSHSQLVRK